MVGLGHQTWVRLVNVGAEFPNMGPNDFQETSDPDDNYNCIAWAIGETDRWWSHIDPYYWPSSAPKSPSIGALEDVFLGLGFEKCEDAELESGFDKVALFVNNGRWSHAAKQLDDGSWTSKLGVFQDIEHKALETLTGTYYGEVHCLLRRKKK